jgi:hypothetical protein
LDYVKLLLTLTKAAEQRQQAELAAHNKFTAKHFGVYDYAQDHMLFLLRMKDFQDKISTVHTLRGWQKTGIPPNWIRMKLFVLGLVVW